MAAIMRPLSQHVFIRRLKPETTQSGIILPEHEKTTIFRGKVIDCGDDLGTDFKRGDIVWFHCVEAAELKLGARGEAFSVHRKEVVIVEEP